MTKTKLLALRAVISAVVVAGSTRNQWGAASLEDPFDTVLGLMENPHYNR